MNYIYRTLVKSIFSSPTALYYCPNGIFGNVIKMYCCFFNVNISKGTIPYLEDAQKLERKKNINILLTFSGVKNINRCSIFKILRYLDLT